jgi:hypothetical protein
MAIGGDRRHGVFIAPATVGTIDRDLPRSRRIEQVSVLAIAFPATPTICDSET